MTNLLFYTDKDGKITKCVYKEDLVDKFTRNITLPSKEINELFIRYLSNERIGRSKEKRNGGYVYNFIDVDVDEMDSLIDRMKEMKEEEKLSRKNKFKKKVIKTSAFMLAMLTAYSVGKYSDSIDLKKRSEEVTEFFELLPTSVPKYNGEIEINKNLPEPTIAPETITPQIEEIISEKIVPPEPTIAPITYDSTIKLSIEDKTESETYYKAYAYYFDAVKKEADRYGIDPLLAIAIASQERGEHSTEIDPGGGAGLFQIQMKGGFNWENSYITAYNFETNSYETTLITTKSEDPSENVTDIFRNIKIACMIIQDSLVRYNYDIPKAITAYNYGPNFLNSVLSACSNDTGIPLSELNDPNNLSWLDYRGVIAGGDATYLENVFRYVPDNTSLTFKKTDGTVIHVLYDNLSYDNTKTLS